MKAVPIVPVAVVALVMMGGGGLTVSASVALPVPPLPVALRVTAKVPTEEGVPEINPVVAFTDKPVGNPVAP